MMNKAEREGIQLADEWLETQLALDEYERHGHPEDKATVLGDLCASAHQAKLAYRKWKEANDADA